MRTSENFDVPLALALAGYISYLVRNLVKALAALLGSFTWSSAIDMGIRFPYVAFKKILHPLGTL